MEEPRNASQDFALRSFSTAGSAHEKISYIASHKSEGSKNWYGPVIGWVYRSDALRSPSRGHPFTLRETPGFIRKLIIRSFCFWSGGPRNPRYWIPRHMQMHAQGGEEWKNGRLEEWEIGRLGGLSPMRSRLSILPSFHPSILPSFHFLIGF